ncbi:hypothetical protein [Shewanella colwelliana]|uniref:hypothetical protein n=1 Tax=Shewanella colwelliana TaxID=23 RepID=UPI0037358382
MMNQDESKTTETHIKTKALMFPFILTLALGVIIALDELIEFKGSTAAILTTLLTGCVCIIYPLFIRPSSKRVLMPAQTFEARILIPLFALLFLHVVMSTYEPELVSSGSNVVFAILLCLFAMAFFTHGIERKLKADNKDQTTTRLKMELQGFALANKVNTDAPNPTQHYRKVPVRYLLAYNTLSTLITVSFMLVSIWTYKDLASTALDGLLLGQFILWAAFLFFASRPIPFSAPSDKETA